MTAIRCLTKLLIGLALCCSASSAYAQASTGAWDKVPLTELKAGVAVADITPQVGIKLAGYAERTGPSTGVHDPLNAVAIVFDDGKSRASERGGYEGAAALSAVSRLQKEVDENAKNKIWGGNARRALGLE